MERGPGRWRSRRAGALPGKDAPLQDTERSTGDVQQSNPRQAVPNVAAGRAADPTRETYTFTPPNPSLMGAAKSFPNKRVPAPACSGPLKSIYR